MRRRDLLKGAGALLGAPPAGAWPAPHWSEPLPPQPPARHPLPDLKPAHWIWYPSERTLPNTFVLFRRQLQLLSRPRRATGWIHAESRYLLEVNGKRVQWGPPPSDPRWPEADPLDLTDALQAGPNAIGAQVLFYGHGDGTWPIGKPGFLFRLEIEAQDGSRQVIASDADWRGFLAYAWEPGHYKRWYLRALQEEFDARLFPYGWTAPDFQPTGDWIAPMLLEGSPNEAALSAGYSEYALDFGKPSGPTELRARSIPRLREEQVAARLAESCWIRWKRPPREYFELRPAGAFEADRESSVRLAGEGAWEIQLDGTRGAAVTFDLPEQMAGWPRFTIEAPAGTTIELMTQEAHEVGGPPLLNTHFHSWSRFICREGVNHFEPFDWECCRWMQLHIHGAPGRVLLREVGFRRRVYDWPQHPEIHTSEVALDRLFQASINTVNNSALETCMDGAGRERQQYSGDGGHQLHAVRLTMGEDRLPARFLTTYSQGLLLDGYFADSWPAYDRLARLAERQIGLTGWGPILDHSIGFVFDNWYHYLYTGDPDAVREPYPRLLRFVQYLSGIVREDGLLPVEGLGVPSVWMDHQAYQKTRHKQCAFNLYAAAMLRHALAPLCGALGDTGRARAADDFGARLESAARKRFWSSERRVFINNLPWSAEEKGVRMCDRSLATAVLFEQCPSGDIARAVEALVACPPEMGLSYPANACWRYWALAKAGRADVILKDWRERWATMPSVLLNNALQEDWKTRPDSTAEWSHCPVAPLFVTHMGLAGITPLEPGFKRYEIRPQFGDLVDLDLTTYTVVGPIGFHVRGVPGDRTIRLSLPDRGAGELVVGRDVPIELERAAAGAEPGWARYRLPAGKTVEIRLK